jgi:hypothetical protein
MISSHGALGMMYLTGQAPHAPVSSRVPRGPVLSTPPLPDCPPGFVRDQFGHCVHSFTAGAPGVSESPGYAALPVQAYHGRGISEGLARDWKPSKGGAGPVMTSHADRTVNYDVFCAQGATEVRVEPSPGGLKVFYDGKFQGFSHAVCVSFGCFDAIGRGRGKRLGPNLVGALSRPLPAVVQQDRGFGLPATQDLTRPAIFSMVFDVPFGEVAFLMQLGNNQVAVVGETGNVNLTDVAYLRSVRDVALPSSGSSNFTGVGAIPQPTDYGPVPVGYENVFQQLMYTLSSEGVAVDPNLVRFSARGIFLPVNPQAYAPPLESNGVDDLYALQDRITNAAGFGGKRGVYEWPQLYKPTRVLNDPAGRTIRLGIVGASPEGAIADLSPAAGQRVGRLSEALKRSAIDVCLTGGNGDKFKVSLYSVACDTIIMRDAIRTLAPHLGLKLTRITRGFNISPGADVVSLDVEAEVVAPTAGPEFSSGPVWGYGLAGAPAGSLGSPITHGFGGADLSKVSPATLELLGSVYDALVPVMYVNADEWSVIGNNLYIPVQLSAAGYPGWTQADFDAQAPTMEAGRDAAMAKLGFGGSGGSFTFPAGTDLTGLPNQGATKKAAASTTSNTTLWILGGVAAIGLGVVAAKSYRR